MEVKITPTILSIPPFISTGWNHVQSLSLIKGTVHIALKGGPVIPIPDLATDQIELIFETHARILEKESLAVVRAPTLRFSPPESLKIEFTAFNEMGSLLEHNPNESDMPELPAPILEKIADLIEELPSEAIDQLPAAHPGCNCMHCQITRAFQGNETETEHDDVEEEVLPEELEFCQWNIESTDDQVYTVTNKLDHLEQYEVFIGTPVQCTCGRDHCEHLIAVLKS